MKLLSKSKQQKLMIPVVLLYWISLYTYVYLLSSYSAALGASRFMIGMITGAYGFMMMIVRIPLGILSDTMQNRKGFICLGMGLCLVAAMGLYLSAKPIMLMVFSGIAGIAASSWAIFISSYCSYFPENQMTQIIGHLNVMMSAGCVLGSFFGGLTAQLFGIHKIFLAAVAAAIIGAVLLFPIEDTYQNTASLKQLRDYVGVVAGDSKLLFYSLLAAAINFVNVSAINSFVPIILTNLGASSFQISTGSTLCVLSGVIAAPLSCTILKSWLGVRKTAVLGFFTMSIPMFFFTRTDNIILILILESLSGFGRNMMFPLFTACATSHLHEQMRSTGLSTFQAIYAAGMFIGPTVTGAISDLLSSLDTTFTILAVFCIMMSIYAIFTKHIVEE